MLLITAHAEISKENDDNYQIEKSIDELSPSWLEPFSEENALHFYYAKSKAVSWDKLALTADSVRKKSIKLDEMPLAVEEVSNNMKEKENKLQEEDAVDKLTVLASPLSLIFLTFGTNFIFFYNAILYLHSCISWTSFTFLPAVNASSRGSIRAQVFFVIFISCKLRINSNIVIHL